MCKFKDLYLHWSVFVSVFFCEVTCVLATTKVSFIVQATIVGMLSVHSTHTDDFDTGKVINAVCCLSTPICTVSLLLLSSQMSY